MRKPLFRTLLPGLLIVLTLAAGCVPIPARTGASSVAPTTTATTEVTATAAVTPTTEMTATLAVTTTTAVTATTTMTPTGAITATVAPTAEVGTSVPPGATVPAPSGGTGNQEGGRSVTLEENGKTVALHPGDRFLLNLGEGYDWEVTIADQNVVSRVIGVLTIQGSQGLFEAHQAGATALTAIGNPTCLSQQPPCALPSQLFQVQIAVSQ